MVSVVGADRQPAEASCQGPALRTGRGDGALRTSSRLPVTPMRAWTRRWGTTRTRIVTEIVDAVGCNPMTGPGRRLSRRLWRSWIFDVAAENQALKNHSSRDLCRFVLAVFLGCAVRAGHGRRHRLRPGDAVSRWHRVGL